MAKQKTTYTTISGDTWDKIAKTVYGNELYADYLMENNPKLINIFVFGIGTVVNTPELPAVKTTKLPPWRK